MQTSVIRMIFSMNGGATLTLNLPDPKSGLNRTEVDTFMNACIDGNFLTKNGLDLVGIKDAYIYQTNKVEIPEE